jgi:hypothetical protein
MKKDRLLEIIREEISEALNVLVTTKDGKTTPMPYNTQDEKESIDVLKQDSNITNIKTTAGKNIKEEEQLNEIPDFGGKLDQGVAKEFGEKNTLQNAVDKIVDETLADMGVTLEDLKKDKTKATEALTSIREKVLGAKRKNIPQDPRVIKALEKQEDIEVATLGAISGKSLQQNQTDNAIKKALGIVTPDKRGRKADPNKPEKPASTGKKGRPAGAPKAEKVATRTPGDDGFDNVSYSDDEESAAAVKAASSDSTAKELASTPEEKKIKFNQFLASVKKNKDDKAKIDGILKLAKDKFKFAKSMMDDLKRAAGREVEA